MANEDSTPIASTRVRPIRPSIRSLARGSSKTVRWNLSPSSASSPTPSSATLSRSSEVPRAVSSSSTDALGRLSLAQNTIRQLRRDVEARETELAELRTEKEKYEESHGRLYSQMSSLRNKCQAYEQQLISRTAEWEETDRRNRELEEECVRLRAMFVEEAAKHGQRTKTLEAQLAAIRLECESAQRAPRSPENGSQREDRAKYSKQIEALKKAHESETAKLSSTIGELQKQNEALLEKLEESRTSMTKLSTEKACLLTDIRRLQDEQKKASKKESKDAELEQELHMRLAELETERSNAKTALKKAMVILDQEEELRSELASRDARIKELERLLASKPVILPPIDWINASSERAKLESQTNVPPPSSTPPQERSEDKEIPLAALYATSSAPEPVFAVPVAPIKSKTEDATADQIKNKLTAIHNANSRLRQMAARPQ